MSHMLVVRFKDTKGRAEAELTIFIAPWLTPLETKTSTFVDLDEQEGQKPHFSLHMFFKNK